MDGRSVYTPLFSGVFWDVQDTMLEDIERIEVIRGPGAALWGANAVNGVINIITKDAHATKGGLLSASYGTEENGVGSIRYGLGVSEDLSVRIYAKYLNRDDQKIPYTSRDASDEWSAFRSGFRTDWKANEANQLRLQGDFYTGEADQERTVFIGLPPFVRTVQGRGTFQGGNLLASWNHIFSADSDLSIQAYYDRTERHDRIHHEVRDTLDLDGQHRFALGERNEFLYGFGYRYSADELSDGRDNTGSIAFIPAERHDQLFSSFIQDEIELVPETLRAVLGSKFEHNDYTGFEVQPNLRLAYTPHEKHTIWTSVARAVRTPSRFEHTISAWIVPPPSMILGNPDYRSEELIAYELGYRVQPLQNLSFDIAAFYNDYEDLRLILPTTLVPAPGMTIWQPVNDLEGETYGTELVATWRVLEGWRLTGGYTWLQMNLHTDPKWEPLKQLGMTFEGEEGTSPRHQFHLRSYVDLPHNVSFDTAAYYVDNLSARAVQSYIRLDARLAWRPTPDLEISLVGQNLNDDQHLEFGNGFLITPSEIERSVYAKVTYKF